MKRFFVILLFFFGSYTVYSQTIDSFLKSFINNDNLSDSVAVFIHKQGLPYNNSDSVAIALDISRDYYGDTLIAIHTYYGKPSWVKEYICFDHDKITVYVSSPDNYADYLGLIDNSHAKKVGANKTQLISKNNIVCYRSKQYEVFDGNIITPLQVKDVFPEAKSNCRLYVQANHPSSWVIVFRDDSRFEAINTLSSKRCIFGKWYIKDNYIYLAYKLSINLNDGNIEHDDSFRYDYFPEVYPECLELIEGILYDRTNYSKFNSGDISFFYEELLKDMYFVPLQLEHAS